MWSLIEMASEAGIEGLNRRTQLLLPLALKVAKSDFGPRIAEQLAHDQGSCYSRGVLFLSMAWQVAQ